MKERTLANHITKVRGELVMKRFRFACHKRYEQRHGLSMKFVDARQARKASHLPVDSRQQVKCDYLVQFQAGVRIARLQFER